MSDPTNPFQELADQHLGNQQVQPQTQQTQLAPPVAAPQQPPRSSYQVPAELVALPSRGLVYPIGSPLSNEETVEIKSMTAKEEDILTSRALIKNGTVISQLLKSCILNRLIDPDEMLTGDKNAVLIGIRVTGYGSEYSAKITCPHCSKEYENTFSLNKLKVKSLGAKPLQPNTNLFDFILPSSGGRVVFKLLNGRDESELVKIVDSKKKLGGQIEGGVTNRLFQAIVEINGESDKQKLSHIIQNMRAMDARALRKYMDEIEPAVDLKQEIVCPSCDEQSEVIMPLGMSFLWPDLGK
jgi:hypothetical protein